ncbi:MAG: hypothetical protein HOE48_10080, partial [Candidatus Latescibacteria bacterium]|nr:hypothetical protein [Candidatus Latescibacterota bacterium]
MKVFGKSWFLFYAVLAILLGGVTGAAQAEDVTFRLVNFEGGHVDGSQLTPGWPYTWENSPYTKDINLPTTANVRVNFIGLWGSSTNYGGTTRNVPVAPGRAIEFDFVGNVVISDQPSVDGSTSVDVVIDAIQPTFGTVDLTGNDITGGQIVFPTFNSQTENTPYIAPGFVRNKWTVSLRGKLDGVETATKVATIERGILQRIDAQNVSQVTPTPLTGTRIDFQYGVFSVPVQTVNGAGAAVTGEIKIGGGAFQPSPVTLSNQLPGTLVSVQ